MHIRVAESRISILILLKGFMTDDNDKTNEKL